MLAVSVCASVSGRCADCGLDVGEAGGRERVRGAYLLQRGRARRSAVLPASHAPRPHSCVHELDQQHQAHRVGAQAAWHLCGGAPARECAALSGCCSVARPIFLPKVSLVGMCLQVQWLCERCLRTQVLHAQQQQRQRFKALDRFKAAGQGVLLATDVAARGLDIPAVSCVIQYQLPPTADTYIHRAGRTARGAARGVNIAFVVPNEAARYRGLHAALGRDAPRDFPVDYTVLPDAQVRSMSWYCCNVEDHTACILRGVSDAQSERFAATWLSQL